MFHYHVALASLLVGLLLAIPQHVRATTVPGPVWQTASTPTTLGFNTSTSCADALHCWVTGDDDWDTSIAATPDGGTTGTHTALPTATRVDEIFGIACPTTTVCWVDGLYNSDSSLAVERSTDGGVTWAPVSIPATIEQQTRNNPWAYGISCPDATHCRFESFGSVVTTNDGGSTWSFITPPANTGFGNTLSCPDDTHCYIADGGSTSYPGKDAVLAFSDGGQTWAAVTGLSTNDIRGLDCVSPLQCTAVGETSSNGTPPGNHAYAASTVNGWATFQAQSGPATLTAFSAVSCTDAIHCWASGGDPTGNLSVAVTSDGGGTWTQQVTPPKTGRAYLNSIACAAWGLSVTCFAVTGGPNSSAPPATVITSQQMEPPSTPAGAAVCPPQCTSPIAAGGLHSVALQTDGSVIAWGDNSFGQLGNGSFTSSAAPVAVTGLRSVSSVAAGRTHSLALTSQGAVMAWGTTPTENLATARWRTAMCQFQFRG